MPLSATQVRWRWEDIYSVLSSCRVVDLARDLENDMPCSPSHPGFRMALVHRHGDGPIAEDNTEGNTLTGAGEIIVTGGHVGTHIDAVCHAALDGQLHGGHDAVAASRGGRFSVHGVETVPPLICRGVLADIPALLGVDRLRGGYGISAEEARDALARTSVGRGDVVLVRTGWSQMYADKAAYLGRRLGAPGITEPAARYLAELGVRAVGTDTLATDQIVGGQQYNRLPAHGVLLVERGVYIIEVMNLEELARIGASEFLFIAVPLKIVGGTGSPIRPLAVIPFGDVDGRD